jgi:hypothetical protein
MGTKEWIAMGTKGSIARLIKKDHTGTLGARRHVELKL